MARYEGASHTDTIEMLTGLRYVEGERSRGITTGNSSPTLVKGDVGIAIPIDRDPRTGEKKKKLKVAEEYVCTDCGAYNKSCVSRTDHRSNMVQEHLIPQNGGKVPRDPRLFATLAAFDGRKRRRRRMLVVEVIWAIPVLGIFLCLSWNISERLLRFNGFRPK